MISAPHGFQKKFCLKRLAYNTHGRETTVQQYLL